MRGEMLRRQGFPHLFTVPATDILVCFRCKHPAGAISARGTGVRAIQSGLTAMQEAIHPNYVDCAVTCSCGNQFKTRATKKELRIDICNACHPFYTGKLKFLDTAGRIEKFQKKFEAGTYASLAKPVKKKAAPAADES